MRVSKLRVLASCAAVMMASSAQAYTNKTYMTPRPVDVNVPWWNTTYEDLIFEGKNNSCGSIIQLTGLYQESTDRDDAGKYFLLHDKSTVNIVAKETHTNTVGNMDDVDITYLVNYAHNRGDELDVINKAHFTLGLKPCRKVVGVGISYHQRFDWALSGLFIYANAPIVAMQQGVHFALKGQNLSDDLTRFRYEEIYSYFVGGRVRADYEYPPYYNNANPPDLPVIGRGQTNLTHAKLTGKQGTAGFSDIDFGLGWAFFDRPKYHAAIAIAATAPAGNKPRGEYVFEPIRGNGGHWALGGNLDGWYRLYKGKAQDLRFNVRAEVRYLFKSGETRTLGLKNRPWGQYYLLGHDLGAAYNEDTTITQKVPAANVLTRKVDVTPGVQFDGTASLVYTNGGWSIDLGWNPYARESESVKLRGTFPDNTYAVAGRDFNTAKQEDADPAGNVVDNQFTLINASVDGNNVATALVNNSSIDTKPAPSSQCSQSSVYGMTPELADGQEVPAQKWVDISDGNNGIALLNKTKYGYSYHNGDLRLTLMRAAGDPDIYPNLGKFNISYSLFPHADNWKNGVWDEGEDFNVPVYAAEPPSLALGKEHASRPEEASFLGVNVPGVAFTGIKQSEDEKELIIRLAEVEGVDKTATFTLPKDILSVRKLNIIEQPLNTNEGKIAGKTVIIKLRAHEIITLGIMLKY